MTPDHTERRCSDFGPMAGADIAAIMAHPLVLLPERRLNPFKAFTTSGFSPLVRRFFLPGAAPWVLSALRPIPGSEFP